MANIFELFGKIVVDSGDAQREINETSNKAKAFATAMKKGITDAAKWGAGIATAATTAAVAIGNQIKNIVNEAAAQADKIDKMAQNMGLSTQAYQEWEYVMNHCGLTMDDLQGGMATMLDRMREVDEGSESAIRLFDKLGISCYDLNGNMKDAETMFEEVVYALAGMESETERTQYAMEMFSGAGEKMAPVFNEGADGIEEMKNRAHELGLVMSGEAIDAGVEYTDTIYDVNAAFTSLKNEVGFAVMPVISDFANTMLEKVPAIRDKLSEWEPVIQNTAQKLADTLEWLIENPDKVTGALEIIGAGMLALFAYTNPVAAAILTITGGITALAIAFTGGSNETEKFIDRMNEIDGTFEQTVRDIENENIEINTLLDVLDSLSEKTQKTREESELWAAAVKQLTDLVPEFKTAIDEETQSIIGGTEALRARAEAMKEAAIEEAKQKALQDQYDAVAEAYAATGRLQLDIDTNRALLVQREAELELAKQKRANLPYLESDYFRLNKEERAEVDAAQKEYATALNAVVETRNAIEDAEKDLESLLPKITEAEEYLAAAEKAINGGAEGLSETLTTAAEALSNAAETMQETEVTPDLAANAQKVLQEDLNDMNLTAQVTPVLSGRGYTFSGKSGASRNGGSYAFADSVFSNWLGRLPGHASGLDNVPYDNYIARLHKGETVLTANEASAYRSGEGNARVEAAVNRLGEIMIQVLSAIKEGQVMQLDTGVLVGATAGAMNDRLGTIATRNGRRN